MPNADGTPNFEDALEAEFQNPAEGELEAGDEGAGGEGDQGTPPAPRVVRVGEREVPEQDVESLLEFQAWALQHPQEMANFAEYLRGEATFARKEAPKPKEEDDPYATLDEPLRERLKAQEAEIDQLREWSRQAVTASTLEEANRAIQKAQDGVKEKYGLSEDDLEELTNLTAQSGVLPGIRANVPDAAEATERALDTIYWATPKFRDREIDKATNRETAHRRRKELAGAVGGNAGSLDRGVPSDEQVAKMTPQQKVAAMAAEISESLRGTA